MDCRKLFPALVLIFSAFAPSIASSQTKLYSVDRDSALLHEIDPDSGVTRSSKAITLVGRTVTGATGMAADPTTGKLYALLRLSPLVEGTPSVRELVTIDPDTGVANDIGPAKDEFNQAFSDLAFSAEGTLYGVTGDASATGETLFTLNKTNGTATFFKTLGNGDDGETIAFNPNDGLVYHTSGQNEVHANPVQANFVFETINLASPASPPVPIFLGGDTIDEATALVYGPGDSFLWADLNFELPLGRLLRVTPMGNVTLLGSLDHIATGLAFSPPFGQPAAPGLSDGGIVNNASYAPSPAPVAPGSIAAVFGTNLNDGSEVLVSSFGSDGKLVTSLGGASATINDIPVPMFYSTTGQLGVQIPYELVGQASANIQVTVGGQTSAQQNIFLNDFAPGIFTANEKGTGLAAVLHEDGVTPVTELNPAHPGEVVVFFATGLGAVTPPLATGEPSTGNQTVSAPTVTIDGIPGDLQFSGAAPGFVGLYQINVRIPASTRSAADIPVVVSIEGILSNSVTIAVGP